MKLAPVLAVLLAQAMPASAEPLVIDNGRLFIKARINGVETEALLDSGAEASLVDSKLAVAAGLSGGQKVTLKGSGGEQQVTLVEGVRIEALGQAIPGASVAVLDLGDLSKRLIKRPTSAIVGRELFDAARIRIDLAGADVRALDAAEKPAGALLALGEDKGIETIPAMLGGVPVRAVLDYGNGNRVLVGRELSTSLGLKAIGKARGGGIGGEVERDVVILPELVLAGQAFRDLEAEVDETSSRAELNIGTAILRHFVVTLDFAGRQAWFEPVAKAR
ncbi:MAG: retropepsin-like domain-containing protein [Sphingomonas sp.]|nr:retropepsin-like domain-containing protein [Sphingomonas sp.]